MKTLLNEANPNKLPAACQKIGFGNLVNATLRVYRAAAVGGLLTLPSGAKAAHLVRARVNAGANAGVKAIAAPESAPAADEAAITPGGDILFNAAAGDPLVEVMYFAHGGDERSATVSVVSDAGAIPFGLGGLCLVAAKSLEGTLTGDLAVVARGATPATGEAALADDGESVDFAAADAVTMAELTFVALPGAGSEPASPASMTSDVAEF